METIKILREKSGAGLIVCKNALEEANNNIDQALEILRKQGAAKAAKRSGNEAREGVVKIATNQVNTKGYVLELNSETDFVSRNEKFQNFAEAILKIAQEKDITDHNTLLSSNMDDGHSVKENLENLSGVIGEKIDLKQYARIESNGTIVGYSHMDGRIGVLVALDKPGQTDLARDIAMQIAAANPKYISPSDVPTEEIEKEKEISRVQLAQEGKPENIIEKILEGKINKYFEDVCLIKQEYIKDDKKKIEDILGEMKVEQFVRYSL